MKRINLLKIRIFFSLVLLFGTNGCKNDISAPQYTNPLDPQNPESQGDPFHLRSVVGSWNVTLTWNNPNVGEISGFVIYRSEQADGVYSKISSALGVNTVTYQDETIKNGQSYWYKIVVIVSGNRESSLGSITALRVDIPGLETGTAIDIDGNIYKTVKIGNQWWMAENLKVTHYRNGDTVPHVTDGGIWNNLSTGAFCNYNNDASLVAVYGRLYNWHTIADARKIAPVGWHVPSDAESQVLVDYLGGSEIAGGKMKEIGTSHWNSPNFGATNISGFSAVAGGYRYYPIGTIFDHMGNFAYFWSSTEKDGNNAWFRYLGYSHPKTFPEGRDKHFGFSVRCVRD